MAYRSRPLPSAVLKGNALSSYRVSRQKRAQDSSNVGGAKFPAAVDLESGVTADVIAYPGTLQLRDRPVGGKRKRFFDVLATSMIVLAASPLLLLVAIASKIFNPGPLFFSHTRIGFRGREFGCKKFRTMVVNSQEVLEKHLASNPAAAAEWARDRKLRKDPRVTTFGAFLRKTSLDELPQLINVLQGDMSLVGPRPVVEEELEKYGPRRSAYLAARPGMSGLWQVCGRNSTTYLRRTELDEQYVRSWSMSLDLGIILRTIPEMLASSHAS